MECILEAHPVPDVIWFQGEKSVVGSNRIKMSRKATSKDQYVLTLEISNPTREDGGNYRCNAFNEYGESNANIALNFQGICGKFRLKFFSLQIGSDRINRLWAHLCLTCYSFYTRFCCSFFGNLFHSIKSFRISLLFMTLWLKKKINAARETNHKFSKAQVRKHKKNE